MRIYFARHGESVANVEHIISNRNLDHPLTPKGREQAESLATYLEGQAITHIFSSSVPRASETSRIIAQRLQLEAVITGVLRDFDCGVAEGHSDEAAWQKWHEYNHAWMAGNRYDQHIEGGESYDDVYTRIVPFVQGLTAQFSDNQARILCMSHGGVLSLMLPRLVRNITPALMKQYGFEYTCCIVTESSPEGLVCLEWNGNRIDNRT